MWLHLQSWRLIGQWIIHTIACKSTKACKRSIESQCLVSVCTIGLYGERKRELEWVMRKIVQNKCQNWFTVGQDDEVRNAVWRHFLHHSFIHLSGNSQKFLRKICNIFLAFRCFYEADIHRKKYNLWFF